MVGGEQARPRAKAAKPSASTQASPPPPEGAIPAQYFGMHDHDPVGDSWPDAPIGSYRAWDAGVMWRDIETTPGVYDFSRLDAIVETAEAHDADVLLVLGQTPPFHAVRPDAAAFYGPGASSPPTLESWTAYVRALAERYAGRAVHYQVWNEANVKGFWRGTPAEMALLTSAARDVLASVTPRPTLVAPAMVLRLIGQRAWFDSFYAEQVAGVPVADLVDVVSLQLYPDAEGTPETAMDLLAAARVVLGKHGVDKPIWNTEVNYGLSGQPVSPAPVTEQQAKVAQTLLLNAANGIERVYWYGWDQQQIVDTLLTGPDGLATSDAGRAYRTVHGWLEGAAVDSCHVDGSGLWTCALRTAENRLSVAWTSRGAATVRTPFSARSAVELGGRPFDLPLGGTVLDVGRLPLLVSTDDAGVSPLPPRV